MQDEIEIQNTTKVARLTCEIRFRLRRSDFTLIRILDAKRNPLSGFSQLPGDGRLWLEFDTALKAGTSITLNIDFDSVEHPALQEPPHWGSPAALDDDKKSLFDEKNFIDPAKLFKRDFFRSLITWDRFVGAEADSKRRDYKLFFRAFDLVTNPDLDFATEISDEAKKEKREYIVDGVGWMESIQKARLQSLVWGSPIDYRRLPHEKRPDTATYLSNLMLPVFEAFLSIDNRLNGLAVAEAFCLFANGEMRTGTTLKDNPWNCEPDSAMELHFANFCYFAINSGVDAEIWTRILPGVAASQEFYRAAYRPGKKPPYLLSEFVPENYNSAPPLLPDAITSAYARYSEMGLQEISDQINLNLRLMLTEAAPNGTRPSRRKQETK